MKILVIFPYESVRNSFKMILKIKDHEVLEAPDGESGLKLIDSDIGIVFTDYKMPGINGIEVIKKIKEKYQSIPVVMVSAYASDAVRNDALNNGAFEYIRMPFLMEEIYEIVQRSIGEKEKLLKEISLFDSQIDQLTTLLTKSEMKERESDYDAAINNCLDALKIMPHPKIYLKLGRLYKKSNISLFVESINKGLYFQSTQGLGSEENVKLLKAELSPVKEIYCSDCLQKLLVPSNSNSLEYQCPKCGNIIKYNIENKSLFDVLAKLLGVYDYGYKTTIPHVEPIKRIEMLTPERPHTEMNRPAISHLPQYAIKKRKRPAEFEDLDYEWIKTSNKIKARDGYRCELCGSQEDLHVHHIIPRSEGGDNSPDNLVTLCEECHRMQIGAGHRLIGRNIRFKSPFNIKIRSVIKQSRALREKIDEL